MAIKCYFHRLFEEAFREYADEAWVEKVMKEVLRDEGALWKDQDISVHLTTDEAVRALQKGYDKLQTSTPVFVLPASRLAHPPSPSHLGDIYISLPRLAREARAQNKPVKGGLARVLVQGVLQLLDKAQAADAEERTEVILERVEQA